MPTRSWRSAGDQLEHNHAARGRRGARDRPAAPPRPRSSIGSRTTTRPTFDGGARGLSRRHAPGPPAPDRSRIIATVPADERVEVIATPPYLRGVMPFAAYFEPARFDASPVGVYVVTPGRRRPPRRDARALPGLDQQHEHPRGLPGPPPPAGLGGAPSVADARPGRRTRVRRGLGHVQRADDARGGLRRRAGVPGRARDGRDLARGADRARRAHAPRRGLDRGGDRVPGRAHRVRATERARRGAPLHVHADLQPVVPARQGPAARASRGGAATGWAPAFSLRDFHDALLRGGSLPVSFHRRALHGEGAPAPGAANHASVPEQAA